MRILICEDNEDNVVTMAAWFEHVAGVDVRACTDGKACVETARIWRPDVALLDIGMPGLSGLEVARELRALPEGDKIFLVTITGWGSHADREKSRQAGFDLHLVKPADLESLWSSIQDAVGRSSTHTGA